MHNLSAKCVLIVIREQTTITLQYCVPLHRPVLAITKSGPMLQNFLKNRPPTQRDRDILCDGYRWR